MSRSREGFHSSAATSDGFAPRQFLRLARDNGYDAVYRAGTVHLSNETESGITSIADVVEPNHLDNRVRAGVRPLDRGWLKGEGRYRTRPMTREESRNETRLGGAVEMLGGSSASGVGGALVLRGGSGDGETDESRGGHVEVSAGASAHGTGGSVLVSSGYSASGTSGDVSVRSERSGASGVSGDVLVASGQSCAGDSGSLTLHTGASTGGAGGDIRVAVGSGDLGDGGAVVVSAGDTSASSSVAAAYSARPRSLRWLCSGPTPG